MAEVNIMHTDSHAKNLGLKIFYAAIGSLLNEH